MSKELIRKHTYYTHTPKKKYNLPSATVGKKGKVIFNILSQLPKTKSIFFTPEIRHEIFRSRSLRSIFVRAVQSNDILKKKTTAPVVD